MGLLLLSLYLVVLAATPALHHDVACHLKSPTHCDACTANPLASRAETSMTLACSRLLEVGRVETRRDAAPREALSLETSGRSPPA